MSLTTTYEYDLNGNQTQKTLANGAVENRSYDSRNRVTQVQNVGAAGVLSQYDYTYDGVENVTEVDETYPYGALTARTIVNEYDGANRLTSEQITTGLDVVTTVYTYDKGHNRTSKVVTGGPDPGTTTYVIGDGTNGAGANQILSVTLPDSTVIGFTYDANGNRYQKTIGGTSDTYTYDEENRLISLQKNLGANTGLYSYAYDYRTRRVSRTEPGSADTTLAVFNGGTSIVEYSASGTPATPSAEFVRGEGQGGGVGGLEYNGSAVYNQYNSRGDVVGQTDDTGALTYQAGYEAFGKHPDESGSSADRQRANTKEQDPTGLLNEGFRYRDLETGTFITRDPLGDAAGPNMYVYCGQNPWSKFDPVGLKDQIILLDKNDPNRHKNKDGTVGPNDYELANQGPEDPFRLNISLHANPDQFYDGSSGSLKPISVDALATLIVDYNKNHAGHEIYFVVLKGCQSAGTPTYSKINVATQLYNKLQTIDKRYTVHAYAEIVHKNVSYRDFDGTRFWSESITNQSGIPLDLIDIPEGSSNPSPSPSPSPSASPLPSVSPSPSASPRAFNPPRFQAPPP